MENQNTQISLYQGVEVEQTLYMAAFSQENGLQSIVNQIIEQAKAQAAGIDTDMTATKNRKALASLARTVASAKVEIDNTGKSLVEDAKAKIKIVDNNRKNVRDSLDALRDEIRQPVTEWEEAEKAKEAAIEADKQTIRSLSQSIDENGNRKTVAQLKTAFDQVQRYTQSDNIDVKATAEAALNQLQQHIQAAEQHEAQQAEIARLEAEKIAREQAERDAKIAAEAAEKARLEAEAKAEREAAERAKIEAQIKAEAAEREKQAIQERMEAEKRAAAEAERARIEAEQRAIQEAEAKRAADIEHKRKINREILNAILECGIEEKSAMAFLIKAIKGEIPNLKICY